MSLYKLRINNKCNLFINLIIILSDVSDVSDVTQTIEFSGIN